MNRVRVILLFLLLGAIVNVADDAQPLTGDPRQAFR